MAFKGLFIGIDRYDSPEINWLSCANRDAKALHALFTDTLGGETTLLTDELATVAAIRQCFDGLAACGPEDVVVIAFSGHGTETHELVGHDADPYNLARTTIPLTTLGEWCSRIPSRRLLIVLDCCFSGGMGAKALQVEAGPRDIQSVDGKLNQISGTLLRMRRRDGLEPQVIALSAVIGDTNGLERWLGGRLLRRTERPVPLDEGVVCSNPLGPS
jgi:helicase